MFPPKAHLDKQQTLHIRQMLPISPLYVPSLLTLPHQIQLAETNVQVPWRGNIHGIRESECETSSDSWKCGFLMLLKNAYRKMQWALAPFARFHSWKELFLNSNTAPWHGFIWIEWGSRQGSNNWDNLRSSSGDGRFPTTVNLRQFGLVRYFTFDKTQTIISRLINPTAIGWFAVAVGYTENWSYWTNESPGPGQQTKGQQQPRGRMQ